MEILKKADEVSPDNWQVKFLAGAYLHDIGKLKEAKKFLKMISEYKHKIRTIKQTIYQCKKCNKNYKTKKYLIDIVFNE